MFTDGAKVPCKPYKTVFHGYVSTVIPRCPSALQRGAVPSISQSRTELSPADNCGLGLPFLGVFYNISGALRDGQTSLTAARKRSVEDPKQLGIW